MKGPRPFEDSHREAKSVPDVMRPNAVKVSLIVQLNQDMSRVKKAYISLFSQVQRQEELSQFLHCWYAPRKLPY